MPVVTLFTYGKDQTGNTVSAISLATFLGLTKNKKTLLLSTGYRDKTVSESFWPVEEKKKSLFGGNANVPKPNIFQRGIDDLDKFSMCPGNGIAHTEGFFKPAQMKTAFSSQASHTDDQFISLPLLINLCGKDHKVSPSCPHERGSTRYADYTSN